ncbi:MAG TPA: TetR family transcriptional regulator [Candidatus Saccharimonadales bacterium]|nr:TetR family transcriptional regulator [Candidatus Saccharimonadales bacterium]
MEKSQVLPERLSVREQKKRYVLDTVQREALALFAVRGYHAVTVEHIAKATGISRSTIFRHFANKEAIVLYDSLDSPLADAFRQQPANMTAIEALRATLKETFSKTKMADSKAYRQREVLIHDIPELRAARLNELAGDIDAFAALIAERAGKIPDDPEVRTLASALTGIAIGIFLDDKAQADNFRRFDTALAGLESSLRI